MRAPYVYFAYQSRASTVQSAVIITDTYRIDVGLFVLSRIYFGALALIYTHMHVCTNVQSLPSSFRLLKNIGRLELGRSSLRPSISIQRSNKFSRLNLKKIVRGGGVIYYRRHPLSSLSV